MTRISPRHDNGSRTITLQSLLNIVKQRYPRTSKKDILIFPDDFSYRKRGSDHIYTGYGIYMRKKRKNKR